MVNNFRWISLGLSLFLGAASLGAETASSALPDAFSARDLLWERRLGTHQYTIPIIHAGRLYVGVNDRGIKHPAVKSTGGGILMCMEPSTGRIHWQMPIPRNMDGKTAPYHFNHWRCGVCSQPAFDGERLYIVGPRGDILCLDPHGQANGNDGPFVTERAYMGAQEYTLGAADGDILWRFDLIREVDVVPHDVCGSSPLLLDDFLYACTGNGQEGRHKEIAHPHAPSLVVLDKRTGRLIATEGQLFGTRLLHGNWSSPRATAVNGRTMVLFSGGDGILYAFKPVDKAMDKLQTLEILWQYDCNPKDYRWRDGKPVPYSRWNKNVPDGPSELIASPVVYNGRVYVAMGQSPIHGTGQGRLCCVDAVSGKLIWATRKVDRTLSDVVIHDGLLYIGDYSGNFFCMEADTGEVLWEHDMEHGVWCASALVADGKVFISTEKNVLWVLKAGREKQVLARSRLRSMAITPTVIDGVLYFPTQRNLFALRCPVKRALDR